MAIAHSQTNQLRRFTRRAITIPVRLGERGYVSTLVLTALLLTSIPYVYAHFSTPDSMHFMGIAFNVPDHAQYFSWMRDFTFRNLAADRLTSEPNDPAFFNLLWWSMARLEVWTGLSHTTLFGGLRVVALFTCILSIYGFLRVTVTNTLQRRLALVLATFGGGLGLIWVVVKYTLGQAELKYPLDTQVAESNTFLSMLGFPHFTLALGLLVATFTCCLLAQQRASLPWAGAAGALTLVLGLQHTYDLITIYAILGLVGALTWLREKRFPRVLFVHGLVIVGMSAPPAAYSLWLVRSNEVWGDVLSQFDNAGVFTPNPLHLPIVLGIPIFLALAAFRPRMLVSADDRELFVAAWLVAHVGLIYLPVNFQIHLLLGWQIPISILAAATLVRISTATTMRHWRPYSRQIIAAVLVFATITNVYLLAWRVVELRRHDEPYFLTNDDVAALNWLDANTTTDDVVLADLAFGQYVPSSADARTFLGHWANTLDYERKRELADMVLIQQTSSDEVVEILNDATVTLVVARDTEMPLDAPIRQSEALEQTFQQGTVTIYRVVR